MDKIKEHWIQVKATCGMFSNEYGVSLILANGQDVSFFVDDSLIIKDKSGHFLLKVTWIKDIPNEKKQLVLLPVEPFESPSSRWAEVAIV